MEDMVNTCEKCKRPQFAGELGWGYLMVAEKLSYPPIPIYEWRCPECH